MPSYSLAMGVRPIYCLSACPLCAKSPDYALGPESAWILNENDEILTSRIPPEAPADSVADSSVDRERYPRKPAEIAIEEA